MSDQNNTLVVMQNTLLRQAKDLEEKKPQREALLMKIIGSDPRISDLEAKISIIKNRINSITDFKFIDSSLVQQSIKELNQNLNYFEQDLDLLRPTQKEEQKLLDDLKTTMKQIESIIDKEIPKYETELEIYQSKSVEVNENIKKTDEKLSIETDTYLIELLKNSKLLFTDIQNQLKVLLDKKETAFEKQYWEKHKSDFHQKLQKIIFSHYTIKDNKFVHKDTGRIIENLKDIHNQIHYVGTYTIVFHTKKYAIIEKVQDNGRRALIDLETMRFVGHNDGKNFNGRIKQAIICGKEVIIAPSQTAPYATDILDANTGKTVNKESIIGNDITFSDTTTILTTEYDSKDGYQLLLYDSSDGYKRIATYTGIQYGKLGTFGDIKSKLLTQWRELYHTDNNLNGMSLEQLFGGYVLIEGRTSGPWNSYAKELYGIVKKDDLANPVFFTYGNIDDKRQTFIKTATGDLVVMAKHLRDNSGYKGLFNITKKEWLSPVNEIGNKMYHDANIYLFRGSKYAIVLHNDGKIQTLPGQAREVLYNGTYICTHQQQNWDLQIYKADITDGSYVPLLFEIKDTPFKITDVREEKSFFYACVETPTQEKGFIVIDKDTGKLKKEVVFDSIEREGDKIVTFKKAGLLGTRVLGKSLRVDK